MFVDGLSGAVRILAESGPFGGRQAGVVFGRPQEAGMGVMQQTQSLRSIMFSIQQLCWQNTWAGSGAGVLRQNKTVKSAVYKSLCCSALSLCLSLCVCVGACVS